MLSKEILEILEELMKMDDVLACMVAQRGLQGIVPKTIKLKDTSLWIQLHQTTNIIFEFINKFYDYKLERVNLEFGKYSILIAPINKGVSLIVVAPSLANFGLLNV